VLTVLYMDGLRIDRVSLLLHSRPTTEDPE
jgi:hypothetical protein